MSRIMDIAGELAELEEQHNRYDEACTSADASDAASDAAHTAADLVDDRADALRRALDTLPAATLAEAAVQLHQAAHLAQALHALDMSPARAAAYGMRMERLLLSAMPHVATAAGLDPEPLGWGPAFRFRARRFGALVDDAGAGEPAPRKLRGKPDGGA